MGIIKIAINTMLLLLCSISTAFSLWTEQVVKIQGTFGVSQDQFGFEHQDSGDLLPERICIAGGDKIIIEDLPNGRTKVVAEGKITKDFACIETVSGDWNEECNILGDYLFTNKGGNIWTRYDGKYLLTVPTGELLATYDEKPLELGVKTNERTIGETYQTTIQYDDMTYSLTSDEPVEGYVRDQYGNLYVTINYYIDKQNNIWTDRVIKYDLCGKPLARWDKPFGSLREIPTDPNAPPPPTAQIEVLEEYGPPVIGPDGSVYAWKRTPDTYSILKWEWVDDRSDLKPGPEAPGTFTATPSSAGVYLSWDVSPQDPGCVESYDIERSTAPDGVFELLTTVDKGTVKYDDATATSGTTWYYRVKARAGNLESDYSPVTSATRQ